MDKTAIFNKLVLLITPFCKNEKALENVNNNSSLLGDLAINSARLVDIVLSIEDEFGIEVDDESADKIRTIGDGVNLIFEKSIVPA